MTVRDLIDRLSALNPDATVTLNANGEEYVWVLEEDTIVAYEDKELGSTVQLGDTDWRLDTV